MKRVRMWIVDTDSGNDLLSKGDVPMHLWSERPHPKVLSTANGEVEVKDCVRFYLDDLGESIDALLLDRTPLCFPSVHAA